MYVSPTLVDFANLPIIFKSHALIPLYAKVPLFTNNTLETQQSSNNTLFLDEYLFKKMFLISFFNFC